eukprot:511602-Alexandrium_andersonii.AAC.1
MCIRDRRPSRAGRRQWSPPLVDHVPMTDLDLRLRVEQAAAVDGVVVGVVGEWRLLRGAAGSLPLVIDEPDAARCCVA